VCQRIQDRGSEVARRRTQPTSRNRDRDGIGTTRVTSRALTRRLNDWSGNLQGLSLAIPCTYGDSRTTISPPCIVSLEGEGGNATRGFIPAGGNIGNRLASGTSQALLSLSSGSVVFNSREPAYHSSTFSTENDERGTYRENLHVSLLSLQKAMVRISCYASPSRIVKYLTYSYYPQLRNFYPTI
jgi:hypothetical protein